MMDLCREDSFGELMYLLVRKCFVMLFGRGREREREREKAREKASIDAHVGALALAVAGAEH